MLPNTALLVSLAQNLIGTYIPKQPLKLLKEGNAQVPKTAVALMAT